MPGGGRSDAPGTLHHMIGNLISSRNLKTLFAFKEGLANW
jgi:hypothetical protein